MSNSFPRPGAAVLVGAAGALLSLAAPADAQLRVATWNISNYTDTNPNAGRSADLKTAIYGQFEDRRMAPDVFLGQEFQSLAAANNFVSVLNSAPGSPGDWALGGFAQGEAGSAQGTTVTVQESDSAFFYRTSKVNFVGTTKIASADAGTSGQPRDTLRFDVSLKGYAGAAPGLSLYSVHMKAGSAGEDQARRLVEAQRIHDDARSLPAGRQFLVGGDFNVQSSNQSAYAKLVGTPAAAGPFKDPIRTPGAWNNNDTFRYVHTQDPWGPADSGMDDRHDQILLGAGLADGTGFDYIGNPNVAYSTSTWDDPNHSYRAWGNDGTSYDQDLKTTGNAMVGGGIGAALKNVATSAGGHLPIFLDLRTPAELAASVASINFGTVQLGADAAASFDVFNGVDANIWGVNGVAELAYAMRLLGSDAFSIQPGQFTDAPGGSANNHLVGLDTRTPGLKTGTIDLFADGMLAHSIALQANVVPEPTGMALVGVAVISLLSRRRRHTRRRDDWAHEQEYE